MNSVIKKLLCCTILFSASSGCFAWSMVCPDTVRLAHAGIVTEEIPAEFEAHVRSDEVLRLTGASVFDGPVEDNALLKPETSTPDASPREVKIIWSDLNGVTGHTAVASCDYEHGLVRLVQKTEATVKQCTAIYRRQNAPANLNIRFLCN